MKNDGIIKKAIGGIVGIKILETGMKLVNNQRSKIKKEGFIDATQKNKKKKKRFY